jgi:hypothetical protein
MGDSRKYSKYLNERSLGCLKDAAAYGRMILKLIME